jgi:putative addiction module component (TIGR02574 family)
MGLDSKKTEDIPVTEEDKRILDKRLEDLKSNPDEATPWQIVKQRIWDKI